MSRAISSPHGSRMGNGKYAKTPMKTLKRLLIYAFSKNKLATCFVVFFVLLSSVANVTAASRVSDIIKELLGGRDVDLWAAVYPNIIIMACIYFVGAISSFAYNLIMMYIAQGTLKKMRIEKLKKQCVGSYIDNLSILTNTAYLSFLFRSNPKSRAA